MDYDIYTKEIHDSFIGTGQDSLIVEDGVIVAYDRTWDDPWATPGRHAIQSELIGQAVARRGTGWRKLRGFRAENAQGWAADAVWLVHC